MGQLNIATQFSFLPDKARVKLATLQANHPGKQQWMMHELCNYLGIDPAKGLLVFRALEAAGVAKHYLLVYHCEETFIAKLPFAKGFPTLPLECPECQNEIERLSELRFDSMVVLTGPVVDK